MSAHRLPVSPSPGAHRHTIPSNNPTHQPITQAAGRDRLVTRKDTSMRAAAATDPRRRRRDEGFTLIEILIAIVLVGILSAVVVLGVSSLTSSGKSSACTASLDAAKAASVVHFANTGSYPATFTAMTGATPQELTLPTGASVSTNGLSVTGNGWTLTLTPGTSGAQPTFACS